MSKKITWNFEEILVPLGAILLIVMVSVDFAWADSCLRPATVGENSDKAGKLKEELQNNKTAVLDTEEDSKGRAKVKDDVQYQLSPPQTLILYAEPLLGNSPVKDLEDTLQVLIKNNALDTIVIYSEESANGDILEKITREINLYLRIIKIKKEELLSDYTEAEEVEALIKLAQLNGIEQENIFCVLKGTVKEQEALRNTAKKSGIPILVFKGADGENLYSIAEVIQRSKAAQKVFNPPSDGY